MSEYSCLIRNHDDTHQPTRISVASMNGGAILASPHHTGKRILHRYSRDRRGAGDGFLRSRRPHHRSSHTAHCHSGAHPTPPRHPQEKEFSRGTGLARTIPPLGCLFSFFLYDKAHHTARKKKLYYFTPARVAPRPYTAALIRLYRIPSPSSGWSVFLPLSLRSCTSVSKVVYQKISGTPMRAPQQRG